MEHQLRTASNEDTSLPALLEKIGRDLQSLLQSEVELAKLEISKKITQVETSLATLGIGLMLLLGGLLVLVAAAVLGLAVVLPAWAAALAVGAALAVLGGALTYSAKRRLSKLNLAPNKTLRSLESDAAAVKEAST